MKITLAVLPVTLLTGLLVQMRAHARSYPAKSVRIVVGFALGGVTDATARPPALKLTGLRGQTVVVDNRPGAGGAA